MASPLLEHRTGVECCCCLFPYYPIEAMATIHSAFPQDSLLVNIEVFIFSCSQFLLIINCICSWSYSKKTLDAKFRSMYPRSISTAQMWDSKIAHKELKFQFTLPACTRLRPSIGSTKPCIPAPPSLFVFRERQIWTGKTWYSWKRIAKE
jgi:hypothetical protein